MKFRSELNRLHRRISVEGLDILVPKERAFGKGAVFLHGGNAYHKNKIGITRHVVALRYLGVGTNSAFEIIE